MRNLVVLLSLGLAACAAPSGDGAYVANYPHWRRWHYWAAVQAARANLPDPPVGTLVLPTPAPDATAVARAVDASGAHRLLAACRSAYAKDAVALHAALVIAPSGAIERVQLYDADGPFADCAASALRTTNLAPFDGPTTAVDLSLAL